MFSTNKSLISSFVIVIAISSISSALEYESYIFTTKDVIFFGYENGTMLELYDSDGYPKTINPNTLNKGQHAWVELTKTNEVYKVCGSKKFAVLMGDAASEEGGVSGYYAMDAKGLGTSTEFYTYVPYKNEFVVGTQRFIVFAYQDNTSVTVQQDITNGVYQNIATFTLNKGQHWTSSDLSNKYIHVTADKLVSALTCFDQGYFVPSANGKWSGTEFYTYVGDVGMGSSWDQDLTVTAFDDDTSVTIKDSDNPNIIIWSGTLSAGEAKTIQCSITQGGLNRYYTITSNKTITVNVLPWISYIDTYGFLYGVFIPDRGGTGVGRVGKELIGSTLYNDYLYIISHSDCTFQKIGY